MTLLHGVSKYLLIIFLAIQSMLLDKWNQRLVFFPLQQVEIFHRYASVRNRAWRLWLQRIWRASSYRTYHKHRCFPHGILADIKVMDIPLSRK